MIAKLCRAVKQKGYFALCRAGEMLSTGDEVAGVIIMSQSWNNIKPLLWIHKNILSLI